MSNQIKRTIILTRKKHPEPLTEENYFSRDDALIASNARKSLELKNSENYGRKTNQLIRFISESKKVI